MNGIFKLDKTGISTTASRSAFDDKAKDLYVAPEVPVGGIIPNSTDLIWEDSYGGNLNFTTATSSGQEQYNPSRPPFQIGTPSYQVPTANMWNEIELEGTDTSCSRTINQAVNTRVELGGYQGWWKDANGNWHTMSHTTRGGTLHPPGSGGLVSGNRGCYDQYFVNQRAAAPNPGGTIINPGGSGSTWPAGQHVYVKPHNYWRWHGWGGRTAMPTPTSAKAIVWQIYARLVKDDPNGVDDRHLARYVIHCGSDRKGYDGTQMWDIYIGRYKRVTVDWQPFNFCVGLLSKAALEANPPPFNSNVY